MNSITAFGVVRRGSRADQPLQHPAHDQPGDGAETPVEQGVLGLRVVARELLDAVVPGEDPEVDPVGARRARTSRARCPGWRPARSAARRRRGTSRRSGTAARPPERAPSGPGRWSGRRGPASPTCPRPRPRCRSWSRCRVEHPAPLALFSDPRMWPCPAPARRRIAYPWCGQRWRTGPRTAARSISSPVSRSTSRPRSTHSFAARSARAAAPENCAAQATASS